MTASPPIKVSLVGPSQSGKTIILPTIIKALENGCYGYRHDMAMKLKVVEDETDGASGIDRLMKRLEFGSEFDRLENEAATLPAGTQPDKQIPYVFELNYLARGKKPGEICQFAVEDIAGEHVFPPRLLEEGEEYADSQSRRAILERFTESTGVVILVSFPMLRESFFRKTLFTLLEHLTKHAKALERVVIAVNHYDLLFMNFSNNALLYAGDPLVAEGILRRHMGARSRYAKLLDYDKARGGKFDIRLVPTSSFGFLPDFGCPNINPNIEQDKVVPGTGYDLKPFPDLERADQPTQFFDFHPFLTADPFIYAATGLSNEFLFTVNRILDASETAVDADAETAEGGVHGTVSQYKTESQSQFEEALRTEQNGNTRKGSRFPFIDDLWQS